MLVSSMIGQAPPDPCDLPVNPDCNRNSWKGQPGVPGQGNLHPSVSMCPELSKLLNAPLECQDHSQGEEATKLQEPITEAAEPQEPIMPSVVMGSVEGSFHSVPTAGNGNDDQRTVQADAHPDRVSRRKTRPIRGRRVNYLFEMLESMRQTEANGPKEDCERTASSPPESAPPPAASPADLSMTCEEVDLDPVQLSDSGGHSVAMAKYQEEMEAYLEELEKYFIEKHGLNKDKPDPLSGGSKSCIHDIVSISRGTQATLAEDTKEGVAIIGPAVEMDLTNETTHVSGESCYTRELEALTDSILLSSSPANIPTTQTKMHLGTTSVPLRNRFHRISGKDDSTQKRVSPTVPPSPSRPGSLEPAPSSCRGGNVPLVGMSIHQGVDSSIIMGNSDGGNHVLGIQTNKSKQVSHEEDTGPNSESKSRADILNTYLYSRHSIASVDNDSGRSTMTKQSKKGTSPSVPSTDNPREASFSQVTPSSGYPPSSMNYQATAPQNLPAVSLEGTLKTNYQVTPSDRSILTTGSYHPPSKRNASVNKATAKSNDQHLKESLNMVTMLNSPSQITAQGNNPQRFHEQHLTFGPYSASTYHGRDAQEKNYQQTAGFMPNQRIPGQQGSYGIYHPHLAHYGQYPGMNSYQYPGPTGYPLSSSHRGGPRSRETPSPGEGNPPKRQRSSSGTRSKKHPSGGQTKASSKHPFDGQPQGSQRHPSARQTQGPQRQPSGGQSQVHQRPESGNTYHYHQDNSVVSQFEKTYQEIANRRMKDACPNMTVGQPWLPFLPNNALQQPSQHLPSNFLSGAWSYGQHAPMSVRPRFQQPSFSNMYMDVNSAGARMPSSSPPTRQPPTHPPPAYRPTGMPSLHPERYPRIQPTQTTPPTCSGQGMEASSQPVGPIAPTMQPHLRMKPHLPHQENMLGQMPLMMDNPIPPLVQVQQQKRDIAAQQQEPMSGSKGDNSLPVNQATTSDQLASNVQRAVPKVQSLLSSMLNDSGQVPSAGTPMNEALDLSQHSVMPQITDVRSQRDPSGPRIDHQGTPQEPVMPKILMVHSEPPRGNLEAQRPFSKSLKQMASSQAVHPPTVQQLNPDLHYMGGNRATSNMTELPSSSSADHLQYRGTSIRLGDHVTGLVEQCVKADSILKVPSFRGNEPSYRRDDSSNMELGPAAQRGPTIQSENSSNGSAGIRKKGTKSRTKTGKSQEGQADPSSCKNKGPCKKSVAPVPEIPAQILRVPDLTKSLSIPEGTQHDQVIGKDAASQLPQVPCSSQSSLEATQEWVNKQFSSAYFRMSVAAPRTSEATTTSCTASSTPVLSALLSQPITSYESPYVLTPQQKVSPITSVGSLSIPASMPSHPVPDATPATLNFVNSAVVVDGTIPPTPAENDTGGITSIQSKENETQDGAACTESLTMDSINALVDTWEGLGKTGGGGIIADAANAAGITDSEEEEIVISIPFSDAETVKECPNPSPETQVSRTYNKDDGQDENIFDRLGTFVSNLEKSPRKEHEKKDIPKEIPAHPENPSGRLKNCTLRLVSRKHSDKDVKSDHPNHKILSNSSSDQNHSSVKSWRHGSPHHTSNRKQDLSDGRFTKKHNSSGKHHKHTLSSKKGNKHSSLHQKEKHPKHREHSSSHHKARHGHSSGSKGIDRKQKHQADQKTSSAGKASASQGQSHGKKDLRHDTSKMSLNVKSPLKDSNNVASNSKTKAAPKNWGKMDKYYGYKVGSLPQHEHNTRFRIVCCHCEEMMNDNIAYMEHVAKVIERSIPPSRMKQLCRVCFKTQPKNLLRHIRKAHLDGGNFICKICNLNFQAQRDLKFHMKRTHKGLTMPYVCKICLFQTSFHSDLKEHFVSKHRGTKALLCHFCTKILYSSRSFLSHYTKHFAKESGVSCSDCVLLFLTNSAHKEHTSNDHKQLGWMDKDGLPRHYESPDLEAIALEAAEKAKQMDKSSVKRLVEAGCEFDDSVQKPWRCLECGGSFIDLAEHLIIEHKCQSCPYTTQCSSAYTQHVVSFHSSFQDAPVLHPVQKLTVFGGQLIRCQKCGYKTSYATNMAKHVVCCPEGVSVVDSFDYLRHRALKEIALREKFDKKEGRASERVITVVPDD